MTTKELMVYIGMVGFTQFHGLSIEVRVVDAKMAYGTLRLQITPTAGSGETWVERSSVFGLGLM